MRVEDELEVAEDVLDLGAVVKGEAADHAVLDLVAAQGLFEEARLRVGAVEDGAARRAFAGAGVGGAQDLLDAVGDKQRLVLAVGGLIEADQRAALARGEERLALAQGVVGDHRGRAFEDDLSGAVVLFEADGADVGEVLLELQNVAYVRAAPTVDGLVLVADDADVSRGPGQQLHQLVLRAVGVLILVDEDVLVTAVVSLTDLGDGLEQAHGLQQQIVEVERVGLEKLFAIDLEDVRDLFFQGIGGSKKIFLRVNHVALCPGDFAEGDGWFELLVVVAEALERGLDDGQLVTLVVDGEGAGEACARAAAGRRDAQGLDVAAQDAHAEAVEGGEQRFGQRA